MSKEINREQIVQFREHDMNRGHNKSQTPVYPITVPQAVLNLAEYLEELGIGGNGVEVVNTLPNSGEEGKIYYSTNDGKYYIYSNDTFQTLALGVMPFTDTPATRESILAGDHFVIKENTYTVLGEVGSDTSTGNLLELYFPFTPASSQSFRRNYVSQYIGRFTALGDNMTILLPTGVHIPDEHVDIAAGHTYEFNILYDTCLITDITYTDNSNS